MGLDQFEDRQVQVVAAVEALSRWLELTLIVAVRAPGRQATRRQPAGAGGEQPHLP
ncbi:MAG: hypothetical protein ACHQE6_04360 [Solirubrobacterales bacterium]